MPRRRALVLALPAAAVLVALAAALRWPIPPRFRLRRCLPILLGAACLGGYGPQPLGHAVGDAATGLAVLRLLPGAVPTSAILPGAAAELPRQSAAEGGSGCPVRRPTRAFLGFEHAIAQSAPAGIAIEGNSRRRRGAQSDRLAGQSAGGVRWVDSAVHAVGRVAEVGLLNGSVHARWSDTLGLRATIRTQYLLPVCRC